MLLSASDTIMTNPDNCHFSLSDLELDLQGTEPVSKALKMASGMPNV